MGYSNYLGDLTEATFTFKNPNPAFGLLLRNHLTDNFGLRLNLLYGKIEGDDANSRNENRGASFESSLVELSLMGEYELFGHKRYGEGGQFNKIFTPYIFGGLGVAFGNPKVTNGEPVEYSSTYFSMPLGAGVKYDISRKINIGLELGGRFTFTESPR